MIAAIPRKYADGATQDAPPKIAPATMAINGSFATTWDKGCCHADRHTTVSFIFNRTGSHDTRNATAGADQHWDKGLTGKTKFTEHSVHDEGNSCHVSASFQECQEDEQDQDLRNESENRTKTCYDTIQDQTSQPFCTADFVKYILNQNRNTWNPYAVVSPDPELCNHIYPWLLLLPGNLHR